jgi:hypothetical protein
MVASLVEYIVFAKAATSMQEVKVKPIGSRKKRI